MKHQPPSQEEIDFYNLSNEEKIKELSDNIKKGDLTKANKILDLGSTILSSNYGLVDQILLMAKNSSNPLEYVDLAIRALKQGAKISQSSLAHAIDLNNPDLVENIVKSDPSNPSIVNQVNVIYKGDSFHDTISPLVLAVYTPNSLKVVEKLIELGAKVNKYEFDTQKKYTALDESIRLEKWDLAAVLYNAKAKTERERLTDKVLLKISEAIVLPDQKGPFPISKSTTDIPSPIILENSFIPPHAPRESNLVNNPALSNGERSQNIKNAPDSLSSSLQIATAATAAAAVAGLAYTGIKAARNYLWPKNKDQSRTEAIKKERNSSISNKTR